MTTAIRLDGVTKTFLSYGGRPRPATLKETVLSGLRPGRRAGHRRRITALDRVTLDVEAGTTVGLIGPNGAGKSTLLRMVAGVGAPDRGHIEVSGRAGALLELGAGFHPELTGRESVLVAGAVAGLSRRELRRRMDDIAGFAGLQEFIDAPVRTYSTGMQARLALSLAIAVDPDVLLLDEVLAVGDIAFQARAVDRVRRLQGEGVTVLIVSHDPSLIDALCDEVVWLRGGRVVGRGAPRAVTDLYREAMAEETRRVTPVDLREARTPAGRPLRPLENRFGDQRAALASVRLLDAWGSPCETVRAGSGVQVEVVARLGAGVPGARLAVTVVRSDGLVCLDTSAVAAAEEAGGESRHRLTIDRLDLAAGDYWFDVGLYDMDWARTHDLHSRAYPLRVEGERPGPNAAVLAPPMAWSSDPAPEAAPALQLGQGGHRR